MQMCWRTERTELLDGEITKEGFIALNEMEAEDAEGDVEDLWITLSSMGLNKGLLMDEVEWGRCSLPMAVSTQSLVNSVLCFYAPTTLLKNIICKLVVKTKAFD